jgi:hypothetical protein
MTSGIAVNGMVRSIRLPTTTSVNSGGVTPSIVTGTPSTRTIDPTMRESAPKRASPVSVAQDGGGSLGSLVIRQEAKRGVVSRAAFALRFGALAVKPSRGLPTVAHVRWQA